MKMDETWNAFLSDSPATIKEFNKTFIPEIFLKNKVHGDVKENFRIIKKLIEYSYFEYKFYDVAALKSVLTLEMALKLRFKEVNSVDWEKKKPLIQLIDWFQTRSYFEVYNKEFLASIRFIRNLLAHPNEHTYSGPHNRPIIENVLNLVNDLYEDPQLRALRISLINKINSRLESLSKGVKCQIDNKVYFAFNAWPAFINNKTSIQEIYFYFTPTFIIPKKVLENTNWVQPPVILFKASSLLFLSSSIKLEDTNGSTLLISEIQDSKEKNEFDDWKKRYEKYCGLGVGYIYPNGELVDTFYHHLREFHKLELS